MPSLDSCINDLFEPGNWASDSGAIASPQFSSFLLTEDGQKIDIELTWIGVENTYPYSLPILGVIYPVPPGYPYPNRGVLNLYRFGFIEIE